MFSETISFYIGILGMSSRALESPFLPRLTHNLICHEGLLYLKSSPIQPAQVTGSELRAPLRTDH